MPIERPAERAHLMGEVVAVAHSLPDVATVLNSAHLLRTREAKPS